MSSLVHKLIWRQNPKTYIWLSVMGLILGFLLLLGSIQLYEKFKALLQDDKALFSQDYLVINKKVSFVNTISFNRSGFKPKEIEEIKKQDFVKSISGFESNKFKIGAFTEATEEIPAFYTELFFQAIPDKFLDVQNPDWKWEVGQNEIPIIFPGDYLKLYNFGFAESQGLPQVSENIIGKVAFDIKIQGQGKEVYFKARIVGLTDKVNSILVPIEFMDWANKNYGKSSDDALVSRLLLETDNPSDPRIYDFLQKKGYETNTERIKNSKTSLFLKLVFGILLFIGLIITLLAVLMFVLSFSLLIVRAEEAIKKLFYLGYSNAYILKYYALVIFIILMITNGISIGVLSISAHYMSAFFGQYSLYLQEGLEPLVGLYALVLSLLIFIFNLISISRQIRNIK